MNADDRQARVDAWFASLDVSVDAPETPLVETDPERQLERDEVWATVMGLVNRVVHDNHTADQIATALNSAHLLAPRLPDQAIHHLP